MTQNPVSWHLDGFIAVVSIDCQNAKVNTLDKELLDSLEETANQLAGNREVRAVVVFSGKPKGFIAGADINLIESISDQSAAEKMARRGQEVFQQWADIDQTVVAAVNGHCLGGGMEFVLACDARIVTPDVQMGLPEVKLGILPGFGGTQRMPRLIGLQKSLELILTGRTLSAEKAMQAGLADRISSSENLRTDALDLANKLLRNPKPLKSRSWREWLLEGNPVGRAMLFSKSADIMAKQTKGHYPAPAKALEVIRLTYNKPMREGLVVEAKALGELAVSKESKNLIHIYQLSQRAKRIPTTEAKPEEITTATVLGAGIMGSGIAWLLAKKGLQVTMKDIADEAISNGLNRIKGWSEKNASEANKEAFKRISGTTINKDVAGSGLVIEAVLEDIEIKKSVITETEQYMASEAIFASNTSSLSISAMQSVSKRPQQVIGLHFFNPVERMPLVEIIRGKDTNDQTIATTFALANKLGKVPILVADTPGFLVNRLLVAYLNEACLLVDEGVEWQSIDQMAIDFGMPMGPFRLIDEVGIDIANEVGKILCNAFSYLQESPLLQNIESSGLLGRKKQRGFYNYQGKQQKANENIQSLLPLTRRKADNRDWQRLMMLMVAEASRCLEEKIVSSAKDIDTGMVFGTGFPPFRGGLCRWADQLQLAERQAAIDDLVKTNGERFEFSAEYQRSLQFYSD